MSNIATKTSNKNDQEELIVLIAESGLSDEAKTAFTERSDELQSRIDETVGEDVSQDVLDGICEDVSTVKSDVNDAIGELTEEAKREYKVAVMGFSFSKNKKLKAGTVVKASKYGEKKIEEWLKAGLIR